jgi:superfamily I DNA/RNA helicase
MEESSRREVHSLYLRYQSFLSANGFWDDGDMTAAVVTALRSVQQSWEGPLYDRVYVDEVQDLTQAEIAVLILASGCRCESVFFAGDTAQSITQGVEFRFEEVGNAINNISCIYIYNTNNCHIYIYNNYFYRYDHVYTS